ncbi:hypothetical protein H6F61_11765 [Cyanobacteria bacterium FACHB-472]|nr:hypothetical protein [Cyanobacteria bacterium FACHB-472]
MSDSPPSQMTRVPTPLIPAVRELARLHRQGRTEQILSGLQSLISAIDNSTEVSIDINSGSTGIAELNQRIKKLEVGLSDIKFDNTGIAELNQRIEKLEAAVKSLPRTDGKKLPSQPPRKAAQKSSSPHLNKSSSSKKRQSTPKEPLIQARLAERLGVDTSTITRRRKRHDFKQWVQSVDPDGCVWEYDWEEKIFYPI